ncbi:MAG: metallophosphoesterase, partial [Flavobacteriales bacterium]|nr:metallophosphoesterase [Flavobacteriales bacterium]
VLIDLYAYKGINTALGGWTVAGRRWVRFVYWAISIGMIAVLVWGVFNVQELRANRSYSFFFSLVAMLMLFLLPKLVIIAFHLIEDLLELLRWVGTRMHGGDRSVDGETYTRFRFLSQLGLALAAIPFAGVLYGITKGRRNFNVARVTVKSAKLPAGFDGLRVVQISDMHLGSFPTGSDIVQRGVDLINAEQPDLILFTGDMVNDYSEEAEPWLEKLSALNASIGKFSILGNHDYSDYAQWSNAADKAANLARLKNHHASTGFRLMLDEHLNIERAGERMTLIGVQNWGTRFQQYGDLKKAVAGTDPSLFRLLMSHDPSHWEAQVQAEKIDLTLSGHTHGAQFGITIAGQTYSPAQWVYKHWAGLYEHDGMSLYVNRGFGFIGFPGRVGMPPEITVFELRSA